MPRRCQEYHISRNRRLLVWRLNSIWTTLRQVRARTGRLESAQSSRRRARQMRVEGQTTTRKCRCTSAWRCSLLVRRGSRARSVALPAAGRLRRCPAPCEPPSLRGRLVFRAIPPGNDTSPGVINATTAAQACRPSFRCLGGHPMKAHRVHAVPCQTPDDRQTPLQRKVVPDRVDPARPDSGGGSSLDQPPDLPVIGDLNLAATRHSVSRFLPRHHAGNAC